MSSQWPSERRSHAAPATAVRARVSVNAAGGRATVDAGAAMTQVLAKRDQPNGRVTAPTTITPGGRGDRIDRSVSERPGCVRDAENGDELSELAVTPRSYCSAASPRCEAFVMTGDKMLRLDSKISPSYAKACRDQLPPKTPVCAEGGAERRRGPFDDFPSMHHRTSQLRASKRLAANGAVPNSHSAHGIGAGNDRSEHDGASSRVSDQDASSVTVDMPASQNPSVAEAVAKLAQRQQRERRENCLAQSAPATPAKRPPLAAVRHDSSQTSECSSSSRLEEATSRSCAAELAASRHHEHQLQQQQHSMQQRLRQLERDVAAAAGPLQQHRQHNGEDRLPAARLAKRLFDLDGFRASDVAVHLSKNNEFGATVANEYLSHFNFAGVRLDAALRAFAARVPLAGETSDRERLVMHFSRRYHACNPAVFDTVDQVHTLTCALLLLNTDLHGSQTAGRRMTCREFIDNLSKTEFHYMRDLLKTLYGSIKRQSIEFNFDRGDTASNKGSTSGSGGGGSCSGYNDAQHMQQHSALLDPEQQVEYKKGWVMRKCIFDEHGKKTPFGRRGWRMFFATLKGAVLYLHKDERGFDRNTYHIYQNAVRVTHCWASKPPAGVYTKRQHVFRVRTADLAEFLFQTSDPKEQQSWVDAVNLVAACFSAPALPAPVGNQPGIFHRPVLPRAPTQLTLQEQMVAHERQVSDLTRQLDELKANAPPLNCKGKSVQQFFYRERYLEEERDRYATYARLLRDKLGTSTLSSEMQRTLVVKSTTEPTVIEVNRSSGSSGAGTSNNDVAACQAAPPAAHHLLANAYSSSVRTYTVTPSTDAPSTSDLEYPTPQLDSRENSLTGGRRAVTSARLVSASVGACTYSPPRQRVHMEPPLQQPPHGHAANADRLSYREAMHTLDLHQPHSAPSDSE